MTLERLARVLQNETHAAGLKPVQWEALRYLARANHFSRNPSSVTAFLGITKGTVSQTLIALERKGLILKTADSADRRNVRLDLTAEGNNLLEDDPVNTALDAAEKFSDRERDNVTKSLQKILRGALRQRDQKAFGQCKGCKFFRENDPAGSPHHCSLLNEPLSQPDSDKICAEHVMAQ